MLQHLKYHIVLCIGLLCTFFTYGQQKKLARVEYYIDSDPGYGKGIEVKNFPATGFSDMIVTINLSKLRPGVHVFAARAQGSDGNWSLDGKWLFIKDSSAGSVRKITLAEYYIDNDPGYGNAIPIHITSETTIDDLTVNIKPSTISAGVHVFGIRVKDSRGAWSSDAKWLFAKDVTDDSLPKITDAEYYIDTDPGYGHGVPVRITSGVTIENILVNISGSTISAGVHVFSIRAKDLRGAWSLDAKWLFIKDGVLDSPANLKQSEYYIDKDPGYGKAIPIAINNSTNLSNIILDVNVTHLDTGTHKLFIRSRNVKNSWSLDNIFNFRIPTVLPQASIVVNSIARITVCQKDSINIAYQATGNYHSDNIFIAELSDSAGNFTTPLVVGSHTGTANSIIKCKIPDGVPASTHYRIRIKSTNPVIVGTPHDDSIIIHQLPFPVIKPTGVIVIKALDTVQLSTTLLYKSYLWSSLAKTSTIKVREYGTYSVRVTDNNNCSATSAPVIVHVTPQITPLGPVSNLCPGTSVTLSSSTARQYLWSTGDTTKQITVTRTGSYFVIANGGGIGDTSDSIKISYKNCGAPVSLAVTTSTDTSASLAWEKVFCAHYYQLRYRVSDSTDWSVIPENITSTHHTISGLTPATTYQWQIRTVCVDSPFVDSKYSIIDSFTTKSALPTAKKVLSKPIMHDFAGIKFDPLESNAFLKSKGQQTGSPFIHHFSRYRMLADNKSEQVYHNKNSKL